ncbi:hypothetical protein ACFXN2_13610 [Streptomyces kronopolitis]|uniref:hypothetical protein n=1 Tax=Streptomyces kronopolitis TaxID=1612435 RepID=UPI003690127C
METVVTVAAILALIIVVAYLIRLRGAPQAGPGAARHGGRGAAARGGSLPGRGDRRAARRRAAGLPDPPACPPGGPR